MRHKKITMITGVLGGIGRATAELFKKNDWYVIGLDHKKAVNVKDYIDEFYNIDLADIDEVKQFCKTLSEKYQSLDCIVNNAAILVSKNILDTSVEKWDKVFAVNTRPAYLFAKFLYPLLMSSKGSIVNISSVHAVATSLGVAAYTTSKGALSALTRVMALEFAKDKIRVNAVLPGAIDTDMLKDGLKRNNITKENFVAKHPAGRIGVPRDIAEMIYFLADNEKSGFITGQEFIIDGGVLAHLSIE